MSRNSSGNYTLPAGNPVVSGSVISSVWANDTMNDIATALTDSLSRSGKGGMTAAFRSIDGVVATPGISFNNETGSGFYRAAAGDVRLAILGADILKWTAAGIAVTGNATVSGTFGVTGNTTFSGTLGVTGNTTLGGTLGVDGAATFSSDVTMNGQNLSLSSSVSYYPQINCKNKTSDANASYYVFDKDRAGAIVQSGDILGNLIFRGYDGSNYVQAAAIIAYVNGTPGTNDMPGSLGIYTTADGASSPTRRVYIDQAGDMTLDHINSNTSATAPNVYVDGSGKLYKSTITPNAQIVQLTAQATTSGSAVGFTGIPSWVKRITVQCSGNASSGPLILLQLGSGSYTTTGYTGGWTQSATAGTNPLAASTAGVVAGASNAGNGFMTCVLVNAATNNWAISGNIDTPLSGKLISSGSIALAGVLDRVQLTVAGGTFTAGSVNIFYEG